MIDRLAVGPVDPQPPRVQVHLAADPPGQERRRAAIFGVADDRVADRRHMRAQLVGASGHRLEFDPCRASAGTVDLAIAGARGKAFLLVDHHLFAARPGLLGERGVDHAFRGRRPADDQRPIDFARGAPGEGLGEMSRGPGRPRDEQYPRRVLVEAMDELGALALLVGQRVEQAVDVLNGVGPALRRKARGLVEHDPVGPARQHHVLNVARFLLGQRFGGAQRT